jgi:hypothetical protein
VDIERKHEDEDENRNVGNSEDHGKEPAALQPGVPEVFDDDLKNKDAGEYPGKQSSVPFDGLTDPRHLKYEQENE